MPHTPSRPMNASRSVLSHSLAAGLSHALPAPRAGHVPRARTLWQHGAIRCCLLCRAVDHKRTYMHSLMRASPHTSDVRVSPRPTPTCRPFGRHPRHKTAPTPIAARAAARVAALMNENDITHSSLFGLHSLPLTVELARHAFQALLQRACFCIIDSFGTF